MTMKIKSYIRQLVVGSLMVFTACWAISGTAYAQIYVGSSMGGNTDIVGEYSTSGTTINPSLISGLHEVEGIAVSGGDLFVVNTGNNTMVNTPPRVRRSTPR